MRSESCFWLFLVKKISLHQSDERTFIGEVLKETIVGRRQHPGGDWEILWFYLLLFCFFNIILFLWRKITRLLVTDQSCRADSFIFKDHCFGSLNNSPFTFRLESSMSQGLTRRTYFDFCCNLHRFVEEVRAGDRFNLGKFAPIMPFF